MAVAKSLEIVATEMSQKGLEISKKIMKRWGANDTQIAAVLSISSVELGELSSCEISMDQLIRISSILNIHTALRTLFNNEKNVNGFMTMENNSSFFGGITPLEFIESGNLHDIKQTTNYLISISLGN
ncbi:hypothetical protein [Vibrio harveyi]|uniref:hypothetical protein n=1 Tax=Vibrio harveyi TaxID=669 RepID=UPI00114CDD6D|nr:hypothetical protein [Vibrio harveyi]